MLQTIALQPGVNTQLTESQNRVGISESQLIRWDQVTGLPEKIGGWAQYYEGQLTSPIRCIWPWADLNSDTHVALGADDSLEIITDGSADDVTPQTTTTDPAVDFSTTATSTTVTIVDTASNATPLDTIFLNTQVSVGGIVLFGAYRVASNVSADAYTITAASAATATVANGGAVPVFDTTLDSFEVEVTLEDHGYAVGETFPVLVETSVGGITLSGFYDVVEVVDADTFIIYSSNTAASSDTEDMNGGDAQIVYYITPAPLGAGTGYGSGGYGSGGYGTGIAGPTHTGTPITSTDWTMGNWGSVLFACPTGGGIYTWQPNSGYFAASVIAEAPIKNIGIFTSMPEQILVAYGAEVLGILDPLLIRWCHPGNPYDWTADTNDQAGSFRLASGSRIIGATQSPGRALIWTDSTLWSMTYIGGSDVFGFDEIGQGCGLISLHGYGALGGITYWMGKTQFHALGSNVETVPCNVWDAAMQNMDRDYQDHVRCGVNSLFNEVWWFYPSKDSVDGENDSYVKLMVTPSGYLWDYGLLARSAWADKSVVQFPLGASPDGYLYAHELTRNANGDAIEASFRTGYARVADGQNLMFIDWVIPDMKYAEWSDDPDAGLNLTFYVRDYPGGNETTYGPFSYTGDTEYTGVRMRGREIAWQVESSDLGSFWRLGGMTFRAAPDGSR